MLTINAIFNRSTTLAHHSTDAFTFYTTVRPDPNSNGRIVQWYGPTSTATMDYAPTPGVVTQIIEGVEYAFIPVTF